MPVTTGNRVRRLVAAGGTSWMINPGGASIAVIDGLARVGARCIFIDCERTAVGIESVTALTRCAHSHDMAVVLRSESKQPELLVRYLDRGIDGIVVPHVDTAAEVLAIHDVVDYVTRGVPERIYTVAQIESAAAVAGVVALAAVDAVDAFLIGPNDLSHSMGFRGDTRRPELQVAVDRVIDALQARQRHWGIPATAESAGDYGARGAKLLYGTLEQILNTGFRPMADALAAATAA